MRNITARWTDSHGARHEFSVTHQGGDENIRCVLLEGDTVIVAPVNKQKKHPDKGQLFVIKQFRYFGSKPQANPGTPNGRRAKAVLSRPNGRMEHDSSADISDLRPATQEEIDQYFKEEA